MTTDPSPLHTYTLTTAEPPEGAVVGDKSKDWKISLLEERLESRIMITNRLELELREATAKNAALIKQDEFLHGLLADQEQEIGSLSAKLRNLQANLDGAHRELASLRPQIATWENVGRDLGAVIATRDATIAETVEESVELLKANCDKAQEIGSLRTQLARATAIEAECQVIARQVPNAVGPIARVLSLFSPKEAT